jgi:iron complex transport system permease protein
MLNSRVAAWRGLAGLFALAAAVFFASILVGSSGIGARRVAAALFGSGDDAARNVLTIVRLPRVLAAFGVGSLLALAGVLLQALFRNPLADPYVLGVSGGAAVGALLAMIAGAAAFSVQFAAVAGALGAVTIVYFLARGGGTPRLLLTGVVLASACGAVISVLLALADSTRVRGMVFWLAGDLEWAFSPWTSALAALAAIVVALAIGRPLNVLAAGELRARSVGLEVEAWRSLLFFACALLTAIAVVSAGTVGFVGLITPHAVRLTFRTSDHRIVAPASAVLGGTLLALADLVARTIASPRQLPVGAIMALVGAPLFIALLRGRARAQRESVRRSTRQYSATMRRGFAPRSWRDTKRRPPPLSGALPTACDLSPQAPVRRPPRLSTASPSQSLERRS